MMRANHPSGQWVTGRRPPASGRWGSQSASEGEARCNEGTVLYPGCPSMVRRGAEVGRLHVHVPAWFLCFQSPACGPVWGCETPGAVHTCRTRSRIQQGGYVSSRMGHRDVGMDVDVGRETARTVLWAAWWTRRCHVSQRAAVAEAVVAVIVATKSPADHRSCHWDKWEAPSRTQIPEATKTNGDPKLDPPTPASQQ